MIFSPDQQSIITGLGAPKGEKGSLVFLDSNDLSEQRNVPVGEGSVVRVLWHSRINQILATLSTGAIHVLYSPRSSIHGALLPLAKTKRTAARDVSFSSADINPVIYTPDALPMYADENYRESLHQREKRSKKFRPEEPVYGRGKGGKIGSSLTQGLVQTLYPTKLKYEDVSPRSRRTGLNITAQRSSAQIRGEEEGRPMTCISGALAMRTICR